MWAAPAFDVFPSKASVARGKEIEGRPRSNSYLRTGILKNIPCDGTMYVRTTTVRVEAY